MSPLTYKRLSNLVPQSDTLFFLAEIMLCALLDNFHKNNGNRTAENYAKWITQRYLGVIEESTFIEFRHKIQKLFGVMEKYLNDHVIHKPMFLTFHAFHVFEMELTNSQNH